MKKFAVILSATLATFAVAQTEVPPAAETDSHPPTLLDAQKAYVAQKWQEAAAAYEAACPGEPQEKQTECFYWSVLALSQTGDTQSFRKAGRRLDSLIVNTNPQHELYADLMMTSTQFRFFLGKYETAAEHLIHAIETSQPRHYTALQKICSNVKAKYHSEQLIERCDWLKELQAGTAEAKPAEAASSSSSQAEAAKPAEPAKQAAPVQPQSSSAAVAAVPASSATVQPAAAVSSSSSQAEAPKQTETPKQAAVPQSSAASSAASAKPAAQPAKAAPKDDLPDFDTPLPKSSSAAAQAKPAPKETAQEYWYLQLGAFSYLENAQYRAKSLESQGIKVEIVEKQGTEKTLYIVQTGHFATKQEAEEYGASKVAPMEYQPLLKK